MSDVHGEAVADAALLAKDARVSVEVLSHESEGLKSAVVIAKGESLSIHERSIIRKSYRSGCALARTFKASLNYAGSLVGSALRHSTPSEVL